VTSVYELGCFAGAMAALAYGERFGRRKSILFGAAVMILGTIIQVTAFKGSWELGQFIIGRVITVSFFSMSCNLVGPPLIYINPGNR
jgi:MFS family permease